MRKYAFLTLVMMGDEYSAGAYVVAKSFVEYHKAVDNIDIICMVTEDVSSEARTMLENVFTRVVQVPYLECKITTFLSAKQAPMYSKWANKSFTKWNVLNFDEYEKVAFIDADTTFMQKCAELFECKTPAATWTNPRAIPFCDSKEVEKPNSYPDIKHGDVVPHSAIQSQLYGTKSLGCVCSGALVLLTPNKKDYKLFCSMLTAFTEAKRSYGYLSCSGVDEQSIVDFYHRIKRSPWHHLHQSYQFIPWKLNWLKHEKYGLCQEEVPQAERDKWTSFKDFMPRIKILHYFNIKPLNQQAEAWEDLKHWHKYAPPVPPRKRATNLL